MNSSAGTILIAVVSAVSVAVASVLIVLYQTERAARIDRRRRAFEQHLAQYEKVYVAARSAEEALNDYMRIASRTNGTSDQFAIELMRIVRDSFYEYWRAVDWRYHPGMAHLDKAIEDRALRVAALMQRWLADHRLQYENVVYIRTPNGQKRRASRKELRWSDATTFSEILIERQLGISYSKNQASAGEVVLTELRRVVRDVKHVISN
jgi:hypothetical protein